MGYLIKKGQKTIPFSHLQNRLMPLLKILFLASSCLFAQDGMLTMTENNLYHGGILIVSMEDSTWADWNSAEYMMTQDSSGMVHAFTPPFTFSERSFYLAKERDAEKKWFSELGAGEKIPEDVLKDKGKDAEKDKWESGNEQDWSSTGRVINVEEVNPGSGDEDKERNRPVKKIIPQKSHAR